MQRFRVFKPQYFDEFQCIGNSCKNNCCHHWEVFVDKDTYGKYMRLEPEPRKELCDNITVKSDEPFEAKIINKDNGNCAFLDEQGLCTIHLRLGHDYLGEVCRLYPRKFSNVDGEAEAFLNLSCEVAARLALFRTDIMRLKDGIYESNRRIYYNNKLEPSQHTSSENGMRIFWALRTASVFIMQSRQYKLWLRLVVLGLFIKRADELLAAGRDDDILELVPGFVKRVEAGDYIALGKQLPDKPDLKTQIVLTAVSSIEFTQNKGIQTVLEQSKSALGLSEEAQPIHAMTERFIEMQQKYYAPFFDKREYILENYLVNLIFMNAFPFNYKLEKSPLTNYRDLVIKYALVKFLLVCMSGYHKQSFGEQQIVDCVTSFSREFDHSTNAVDYISKYLESNNSATVGALSMLIKE